jgi:hypothetical protein
MNCAHICLELCWTILEKEIEIFTCLTQNLTSVWWYQHVCVFASSWVQYVQKCTHALAWCSHSYSHTNKYVYIKLHTQFGFGFLTETGCWADLEKDRGVHLKWILRQNYMWKEAFVTGVMNLWSLEHCGYPLPDGSLICNFIQTVHLSFLAFWW